MKAGEVLVSDMEWTVPVETLPDRKRQSLKFVVEGGDLVMVPPSRPFVVPPESDDQMCDAIRDGREVQRRMGRGLT